jgi:pimeloyl-ACP methyl ester carboxylesterase
MTQLIEVAGGRIAYDVAGEGPLVVLAPGLGDLRQAYRFLAPRLVAAGYRVATVDLRGHGESSVGWPSYTRTDTAGDLLAVIRALSGPAVIVGASFAAGAAIIAAATEPELVTAVALVGPGARTPKLGKPNWRWMKAFTLIGATYLLRSDAIWARYLRSAYPGARPADFEGYLATVRANLREPGRMAAAAAMAFTSPADSEAKLGEAHAPAVVVMGALDPDFPDPRAEADGIVEALPAGVGRVEMIDGAGHYPHAQRPAEVAAALTAFLAVHARA